MRALAVRVLKVCEVCPATASIYYIDVYQAPILVVGILVGGDYNA